MAVIKLKGYEFNANPIRDSFNRRAQQLKNRITETLMQLGITEEDVELDLEQSAIKAAPASVSWYIDNYHLYFSYNSAGKYVDNLFIICKVLEFEVDSVTKQEKSMQDFIHDFNENHEVEDERKEARLLLGVEPDCKDFAVISKKYKDMAKGLHPDMDGGDIEKFKAINRAHKILKRELA